MGTTVALFASLLQVVAGLLPGLKDGDPRFLAAGKILQLAGALTADTVKARDALAALRSQVELMAEEGRPPTEDEWAALKARSDAAHAAIQDA